MEPWMVLERPALFKPDSVRHIDRVIDYFGGVATADDARSASGEPEAPSGD
jgi:hypothetical protein